MKKIFKYYLPLLIFLSALGILFLGYMLKNHIAILKYLAGEARIINKQINAIIKEDGIKQERFKLFKDDGKLYMVYPTVDNSGVAVLVIDKERNDILAPSGSDCYELLFSKYLIQVVTCGSEYYSGLKHGMYNVNLSSNDTQITFQLPKYDYGKVERGRKIEIIIQGER